ncbi:homeobox protein unc-4 [Trichonephila inaurata madagascariensis]|uniref:Homeobox protein unc-4 n=1 Tax=Trichonephila inaurata madagascariensis TaxID=2747483 RepID=A0A8X7C193_9ARAC|nr:homeobox protein unc-4 [Trichonephila inaurata madagascariensis]
MGCPESWKMLSHVPNSPLYIHQAGSFNEDIWVGAFRVWFQNRRAKWRKKENTKKGPGRPAHNAHPQTCSGDPIPPEEIEKRDRDRREKKLRKQLERQTKRLQQAKVKPGVNVASLSEAIYQTLTELRHINDRKEPRDLVGAEIYALLGTMGFDVVDAMSRTSKRDPQQQLSHCSNSGSSSLGDVNVCSMGDENTTDDYADSGNSPGKGLNDYHLHHRPQLMVNQKVNPFSIENILAEDKVAKGRLLGSSNAQSYVAVTQPVGFLVRSQLEAHSPDSCQSSDVSPSDYSAPSSPDRPSGEYKIREQEHSESESEDEGQTEGELELRLRLQEGEDRNVMVVPCSPPPQHPMNDNTNNLKLNCVSTGSSTHRL